MEERTKETVAFCPLSLPPRPFCMICHSCSQSMTPRRFVFDVVLHLAISTGRATRRWSHPLAFIFKTIHVYNSHWTVITTMDDWEIYVCRWSHVWVRLWRKKQCISSLNANLRMINVHDYIFMYTDYFRDSIPIIIPWPIFHYTWIYS